MTEHDRLIPWQDNSSQTRWPCGNSTACLMTASLDPPTQSHDFDRHTRPAPFALSDTLRVQWASTTHVWRLFTRDA
jgi:hypothetical protein